ncbi:MAG: hypothetical protein AAFO07_20975 [Bacteroidota bacterium]
MDDYTYKVRFIDSKSSRVSKLNYRLDGDNLAREMEALCNEMGSDGYELDKIQLIDSHQTTIIEGYLVIFKKKIDYVV